MKALTAIILSLALLLPQSVSTVFADNDSQSVSDSKSITVTEGYPKTFTKKGLEVQYITDATLLGVGHTVVHVNLNELICEKNDNAIEYVYGENKYYIDADALTLLDYRIKTLTDAGIHIYINYILSFDSSAHSALYYPDAEGGTATLFAPNVSSAEGIDTFASVFNFLAERYTGGSYGFCGSYIIGYEVNNEKEKNNAGISNLYEYVSQYTTLLRAAYNASKSAYSNARVYISLSNRWNIAEDDAKPFVFSSKEFLDELMKQASDIPFGVSINPYPSSLSMGAYWTDEKAVDSIDSEYVTMKNIDVLTDYLKETKNLVNGSARKVVISEFGISGEINTESEKLQAAAYAYAYYTAENNPLIEAFIWHRHVDHIAEYNLNYGLYSSSELALDGKDKKLIHKVFSVVDTINSDKSVLNDLLNYLPIKSFDDLISEHSVIREYYTVSAKETPLKKEYWNEKTLFDFSSSLYSFYPTDNSEYIEAITENGIGYMRIVNLMQTSIEYMGAGIRIDDFGKIHGKNFLTVKMRVISTTSTNDFSLIIMGNDSESPVMLNCNSMVSSNEWVTLTFDISDISKLNLENCMIKLWVRSDTSKTEQVLLDVASISLHTKNNFFLSLVIVTLVILFVAAGLLIIFYLEVKRRKRIAIQKAKARARAKSRAQVIKRPKM